MKKMTTTIGIAVLLSGLTGCASFAGLEERTTDFDSEASRAHNLAGAAGIHIRDTAVPEDQYGTLMRDMSSTASNALLFNSSYGLGMTNWGSLGMGVMSTMFSPDDTNEHNSLFGWMPSSLASSSEEAQERFVMTYAEAIERFFDKAGIELYKGEDHRLYHKSTGISWTGVIIDPEHGCPDNRVKIEGKTTFTSEGIEATCLINVVAAPPRGITDQPHTVKGGTAGSPAYFFSSQHKLDYSRFKLLLRESDLDPTAISRGISEELPRWAFIYLAPKREGNPAIVFDQGRPELFVVPNKS